MPSDFDLPGVATPEQPLRDLHAALRYEGLTAFGGAAAFWLPASLAESVLVLLAVGFTPYLIWKLWQAGWRGTVLAFGLVVGLPVLLALLGAAATAMSATTAMSAYLLTAVPLVLFYAFTWALQYQIGDHLREAEDARRVYRQARHA